jgi:taurine--2-oxoglutarate transaminase
MGVSDPIAAHFRKNVFPGGLTYNSHPLALATAEAVIHVMQEEKLVERAAQLEAVMRREMDRLQTKHRSVLEGRCIGLFGIIELRKNTANERLAPYANSHPVMAQLNKFFLENGLFTMLGGSSFMCNPPLTITEQQLAEGFEIIDRGLELTDAVFEN